MIVVTTVDTWSLGHLRILVLVFITDPYIRVYNREIYI